MSFLSNINFGGTPTQTTAFAGSTSFNFGTKNGAFDSGDAANAALDAAASAIPFGSMVKGFLDKMGLSENIDLVSKYGLSSWGASDSPEQVQAEFAEKVFPYIQQKLKSLENGANINQVFNEMEMLFAYNIAWYKAKKVRHSQAKSTRKANEWGQKTWEGLQNKFRTNVKSLKSQGFDVKQKTITVTVNNHEVPSLVGNNIKSTDTYTQTLPVRQYEISVNEKLEVDENGKLVKKSNGFGLVALGSGLLYAIKTGALKI